MTALPASGRVCVFCGSTPVTAEDAWPQWIGRYLGKRPTRTIVSSDDASGIERTYAGLSHTAKVRCVCRACNNGWMHDLEDAASGILKSMFNEHIAISIPAGEDPIRLLLARWAFKTALMIQSTNNQSAVPGQVFHSFYRDQRPPGQALIYIARHAMGAMPNGAHSVAWDIDLGNGYYKGEMYGVTFFVDSIVLQIIGYSLNRPASAAPNLAFPQTFADRVQRVWPAGYRVEWPPRQQSFTDRELVQFQAELALVGPEP